MDATTQMSDFDTFIKEISKPYRSSFDFESLNTPIHPLHLHHTKHKGGGNTVPEAFTLVLEILSNPNNYCEQAIAIDKDNHEVEWISPKAVRWDCMGILCKATGGRWTEECVNIISVIDEKLKENGYTCLSDANDFMDHADILMMMEEIGHEQGWIT